MERRLAVLSKYMKAPKTAIPVEVYLMLGHIQYQQGDTKKALATFQKGHESIPQNENLLLNYGVLSYEFEKFREAGKLFEKLYNLKQKQDQKLLFQSAAAYYQAGDLRKAKSLLIELVTNAKEVPENSYKLLINICMELDQKTDAEKWITAYLRTKPDQAIYWRLLAQIRLDRQQLIKAASALEIAYRLEPPKKNEWRDLGDLYLYLGAPLMAARSLRLANVKNMPEKGHLQIANAYARSMRYDAAIAYLDKVYGKNPGSRILFEKGRLLYEAGRYKDALEVLEQSRRKNPKEGEAYMLMGFIAWTLEDWEKARKAFADAAVFPKYKDQATDAKNIMNDLIELQKESEN